MLQALGPDGIAAELARLDPEAARVPAEPLLPDLIMPARHDVRAEDIVPRRLHAALAAASNLILKLVKGG